MKKTLLTAAIALTGLAAFTSVHATPTNWSTGDVLLAFESTSLNKDLLVDLGPGATFASALSGGSFSSINLDADLISTFGSDWSTNTSSNIQWGLFGLPTSKAIVYAASVAGGLAPIKASSGALSTTLTHYNTLGTGYNNDILNSQGLTVGVEQIIGTNTDTGVATWIGNNPGASGGTAFAIYNVSVQSSITNNLDIYGTTVNTSTKEGVLTVSSTGVISAVPEPATYALFGLGALVLIVAYRRTSRRSTRHAA